MRETPIEKLGPDRLTEMSGNLAAILDEPFSEPVIGELVVTSDGFVMAQTEVDVEAKLHDRRGGCSEPEPSDTD